MKDNKNSDLSAYAVDKSLAEALSLGMGSETLSKNLKAEINENAQKVMTQAKIQEEMQAIQRAQIKQRGRGMDIGFIIIKRLNSLLD